MARRNSAFAASTVRTGDLPSRRGTGRDAFAVAAALSEGCSIAVCGRAHPIRRRDVRPSFSSMPRRHSRSSSRSGRSRRHHRAVIHRFAPRRLGYAYPARGRYHTSASALGRSGSAATSSVAVTIAALPVRISAGPPRSAPIRFHIEDHEYQGSRMLCVVADRTSLEWHLPPPADAARSYESRVATGSFFIDQLDAKICGCPCAIPGRWSREFRQNPRLTRQRLFRWGGESAEELPRNAAHCGRFRVGIDTRPCGEAERGLRNGISVIVGRRMVTRRIKALTFGGRPSLGIAMAAAQPDDPSAVRKRVDTENSLIAEFAGFAGAGDLVTARFQVAVAYIVGAQIEKGCGKVAFISVGGACISQEKNFARTAHQGPAS